MNINPFFPRRFVFPLFTALVLLAAITAPQEVWQQEEENLKKNQSQRENTDQTPDSVTSASKRWLPPPRGYTYQIVLIPEIDGYVIQYSDRLYRGRGLSAYAARQLKHYGLKTIITTSPSPELQNAASTADLTLLSFPFDSNIFPPEKLNQFLTLIRTHPGPYYLHSSETNHHAGILAAAFRRCIEKWPYEKTIIEYARLGGSLKDDDIMLRTLEKGGNAPQGDV